MATTKTLTEAQDKVSASPAINKQPETPEKLSGPQQAALTTTASAAASPGGASSPAPPPGGAPSPVRQAEVLAAGGTGIGAGPRAQMIMSLQRSVGNARVSSLIENEIQTKLSVGAVDDPQEREADRVAESVTQPASKPASAVQRQIVMRHSLTHLARVSRQTKKEDEAEQEEKTEQVSRLPADQEKNSDHSITPPAAAEPSLSNAAIASPAEDAGLRKLQRAVSADADRENVDTQMEARIKSPSGGRPLPAGVQREMETVLDADFSQVRVHDSARDQTDAGQLNAKAFTHGEHIWLGAGASAGDRKLMAHELTHVVQQEGADLSRMPIRRSLSELDERLDRFDVPEGEVIALLGGLTPVEKATVLTGNRYRNLIARALNTSEMVRAVNNLNPELAVKLEWVEAAAGSASSIDYSDIQSQVTSAPQTQRDALNTGRWKTFFVDVCDNSTIIQAVNDLRFSLVTRLEWVAEEVSTGNLSYSDIKGMVTGATQAERDALNNVRWRDFFVGVCDNTTILEAVNDLNFALVTKLEWVAEEVSTSNLSYSDIKGMVTGATQAERDVLKTDHWRDFFVGVCGDASMAEALLDLGWDLRTRLEWMRAEGPYTSVTRITFSGNHAMSSYEGTEANTIWETGDEHSMAYTKGAAPKASSQLDIDANLARVFVRPVTVRVMEGGADRGSKSGLVVSRGRLDVRDLELAGLTGSAEVRESRYTLNWEISDDGVTWAPLNATGQHTIYWLFGSPGASTLYNFAAAKATRYAAGATSSAAVADAVRHGPRGVDGLAYDPADSINSDALSVFADGTGICTDYANLLTLLALSVGLSANAVMFWGGFESVGKNIWVALGGAYGAINMVNVRSPTAAYNSPLLPISPLGWAFNYHAISRIDGVLQDAALDRRDIDGEAVFAGKIVRLVESTGAPLPNGATGSAYSETIPRKDHVVAITVRNYGPQISASVFGTDVYILQYPAAAPPVFNVPVRWTLVSGTLPPGLSLSGATGMISGTPSAAGVYTFSVEIATPAAAGVSTVVLFTLTVTP